MGLRLRSIKYIEKFKENLSVTTTSRLENINGESRMGKYGINLLSHALSCLVILISVPSFSS